jgi:flagellar export protein FliJ
MARFRLQSVLDMKQRREELQQQMLAALAQRKQVATEAIQLLERQVDAQQQVLAGRTTSGRIDARAISTAIAYIEGLHASIATQQGFSEALDLKIHEARDLLTALTRERQTLERLRERQRSEEARTAARREQSEADELVSQRYARKTWEE